jgi:hypothetical protein
MSDSGSMPSAACAAASASTVAAGVFTAAERVLDRHGAKRLGAQSRHADAHVLALAALLGASGVSHDKHIVLSKAGAPGPN